ncbi:flagellar basal body-associated FliL family protein [Flavimaricola marinus]|uniref:Flagellar protein FliL n=1 Tax=Flavimaricola marinus TaxID=1819565 RepID=A0A238LEX7_9RHOB|nr:flagellar basal body-associated FliL family protein [Flavimaricola marinus]SMY08229.1 Flagellar basal body-associated protein FliL [Flavimaricola marinus]
MKLILPLILLLVGTGGGIAAGLFLTPAAEEPTEEAMANPCGPLPEDDHAMTAAEDHSEPEAASDKEYARLNNQFVVPVVSNEQVQALVVVSLSVEVPTGEKDFVFEQEPKLRDAFLQVLFDHANLGGFDGQFTATTNMRNLRTALRNAAREAIGNQVSDVLILELVRQDV